MKILYSKDAGLLIREIKKIEKEKFSNFSHLNYSNPNELITLLNSRSLFNDDLNNFIVYNCVFLTEKDEFEKATNLINILLKKADANIYLLVNSDKLLASKEIKKLTENIETKLVRVISNVTLPKYLTEILNEFKISVEKDAYKKLCLKLLPNYFLIENEIKKLQLLEKDIISADDIEGYIADSNYDNVFKLLELYLMGKKFEALSLSNWLIKNLISPIEILQIFASQLVTLKIFKIGLMHNLNLTEIAKLTDSSLYLLKNKIEILNKYNLKKFNIILDELYRLDIFLKKGPVNPELLLNIFLVAGIGKSNWTRE